MNLSRKTCFGSKKTFILPRPVLQLHFPPRINNTDSEICVENDYSEFALEWLVEELVEDGDEIVCLRVVDKDSKISSNFSVEQGFYKTEARKLLEHIQEKNEEDKAISLVLEFAVGKVPETIQRMVRLFISSHPVALDIYTLVSDQDLRSSLPNCWNTRQVSGWHSRPAAWLREQVLSSELARSRSGGTP